MRILLASFIFFMSMLTHAAPTKWAFFGDSTQAGATLIGSYYYPSKLTPSKVFYDEMTKAGKSIVVDNYAVGGTTLQNFLDGTAGYAGKGNAAVQLSALDHKYIVVNWGINDVFTVGWTPALHKTRLLQLLQICQAQGKVLVLETPSPINYLHDTYLNQLALATIEFGTQYGVKVVSPYHTIKNWWAGWQYYLSDTIHPTEQLYWYIGVVLFAGLKDLN